MGLVPLALWLPVSPLERLLLITVLLLVLIVEILNSAVEAAVDRIGLEHHELSGRAKDLGSAAVLLSLLIAALTWGTVLWTWWVR
jgi:diacylglycerol kinase (ATP)